MVEVITNQVWTRSGGWYGFQWGVDTFWGKRFGEAEGETWGGEEVEGWMKCGGGGGGEGKREEEKEDGFLFFNIILIFIAVSISRNNN